MVCPALALPVPGVWLLLEWSGCSPMLLVLPELLLAKHEAVGGHLLTVPVLVLPLLPILPDTLTLCGINLTENEISKCSVYKFKNLVNCRVKQRASDDLTKLHMKHSKRNMYTNPMKEGVSEV